MNKLSPQEKRLMSLANTMLNKRSQGQYTLHESIYIKVTN